VADQRLSRAVASFARGRTRKARRLVREYLLAHDEDVRARLLLLRAEFALGRRGPDEAVAEGRALVETTFASSTERRAAQLSLAGLLHAAGRRDEGQSAVGSLLEEEPHDLRAHAVMGFFLIQADADESWKHLRTAIKGGYDLGSPDARRVAYTVAADGATRERRGSSSRG
jgi:hypothetical protein